MGKQYSYYNQEIKEKFIEEQKDTMRSNCMSLFESSREIEESLGKDLYQFNKTDIENFYGYLNKGSVKGLMVVHNGIRRYIRWALNKGLCDSYDIWIEDLTQGNLSRYCNQVMMKATLIDRETIIGWINSLRHDFDFYNPRNSFLLLAPFEGINGYNLSEILTVKWEDFTCEGEKYFVQLWNRKIEISAELYRLAEECAFTSNYYKYNKYKTLNRFDLKEGHEIVRAIKSKRSKGFSYVNAVKNAKAVLTMVGAEYVNLKNIDLSGKVYLVKQKAEEHGLAINDYLWSQYFKDEICYRFDMDKEYIANHVKNIKLLLNM